MKIFVGKTLFLSSVIVIELASCFVPSSVYDRSSVRLSSALNRITVHEPFANGNSQKEVEIILGKNIEILGSDELRIVNTLVALGQSHLLESWPPVGEFDEEKHSFLNQVIQCDSHYPGGLTSYVDKAKKLLQDSTEGVNPFEGYTPKMPDGESLIFGTNKFEEMESIGLDVSSHTGFVLVAGGLGERLGFNGIKLALPVESATSRSYLELYAQFILELQKRGRDKLNDNQLLLPLIIMTSEDTDLSTKMLLESKNYFGMDKSQIRIIMQDKVPALADSSAKFVTRNGDRFVLDTKPHGHGDVHHLLYKTGIAAELLDSGFRYLFFFQDTNALVLNSVLPALGVSVTHQYTMNSICVPRVAQEAAGAIVSLVQKDGSKMICNVEYNQLDPLLRATISPEGDVNDPKTGFSPYPGNTNNIVFELASYVKTIQGADKGVVPEFVNPKYKDSTRTSFLKPTRLECMMQDFPMLLAKELAPSEVRVGFTSLEKWLSFSPVKNSLEAGKASVAKGVPSNTAASAEGDFYAQNVKRAQMISDITIIGDSEKFEFEGVPFEFGARLVFLPSFAITTDDLKKKLSKNVQITANSTAVFGGRGLTVQSLSLDGTLILNVEDSSTLNICDLKVQNKGWHPISLPKSVPLSEVDQARGFLLEKMEQHQIQVPESGDWEIGIDGVLSRIAP